MDRPLRGGGPDLDPAARGRHSAMDIDQGTVAAGDVGWRHDLQETIAIQVEGRLFTRTDPDFADRCDDHAGIGDLAAEQADEAVGRGADRALVAHTCRGTIAGEVEMASVEIGIRNAERRGHEAAADGNRPGRRDRDAVGIDEIDLAVGSERAGDGRRGCAGDAVEGGCAVAGLLDGDRALRADGEVLPLDDGSGASLMDRHRAVGGRADRC